MIESQMKGHKSRVEAGFVGVDADWVKSGMENSFSITCSRPCSACIKNKYNWACKKQTNPKKLVMNVKVGGILY